ncbi:MAG: hypothetical protein HGA38_00305 [Candidatus Moranbacteria bacterium]|nr:hypothetical protein [Candidatus Moranbacteria bacterium]NTW45977.1 hypothetical protein [Candidatus Moranbacteria bacterium]
MGHRTVIPLLLCFSLIVCEADPVIADVTDGAGNVATTESATPDTSDSEDTGPSESSPESVSAESTKATEAEPPTSRVSADDAPATMEASSDTADIPPVEVAPSATPASSGADNAEPSDVSAYQTTDSTGITTLPTASGADPADGPSKDAATGPILNELQIAGDTVNDDFVELYNTDEAAFSLKGFELRRKTKGDTATKGALFHAFSDTDTIPGHGYFLWANKDGSAAFIGLADAVSTNKTSPALTTDNSLALFDDKGGMVTSVTWGSGHTAPFSKSIGDNPGKNESLVFDRETGKWSLSKLPTPTNHRKETVEPTPEPAPVPPFGTILINEFLPYPESGSDEWIELRNTSAASVDLSGWALRDASGRTYVFAKGFSADAGSFPIIDAKLSGIALNNTGTETLSLLFPDGSVADSFSYSKTEQNASYARTGDAFRLTHVPTRGTPNTFDPEPVITHIPPVGIVRLNELFPNPKTKGEPDEWIELSNAGDEPVGLSGWTVRSGAGKFTWTEKTDPTYMTIPAKGYLVLPRSLTRLALRNSDGAVSLVARDGTIMDAVSYETASEDASYGYSGNGKYRWSRTRTPGLDNLFGKEPKAKEVSIPKKGYRGVLTPFSTEGNKKKMKYVWDFGDGHRSYLASTRHRYEKTGTYEGTLTLRDGTEEYVKPFSITIAKYPSRNLHLTRLCPNPTGRDTDSEWIRIRNDSPKRVPLSGWSIATGSDMSKLVNHAILSDISVDPGEEIILRHADSRFTFPNGRAVIELRRPDGKTVQTVEYSYGKSVPDDAVYADTGAGWVWILASEDDTPETDAAAVDITAEETGATLTGMTENPTVDRIGFDEFVSLGTPVRADLPDTLPRVLGASDERLRNGSEPNPGKLFLDTLFRMLNSLATGTV